MRNNILKTTVLGVAGMFLASCDSFLDEQPSASSNAPITTAAQLISLYDYVTNVQEYDYPGSYATDDTGIPLGLYNARPSVFSADCMCFYTAESSVMASSSMNTLWQNEYKKIFTANTMISEGASCSGTDAEKNEALCNGYFMRAWSMFKLATTYCLPYNEANRSALGLPLRTGTLFTENVSRATLGETFDQILSDLKNAEETCTEDDVPDNMAWRVSKCAIYGLYARIYMYMNDYQTALSYADKAVALAPGLYDYNELSWGTPQEYPAVGDTPAQTIKYCETNTWTLKTIFPYKEWVFVRLQYLGTQWFCPSEELMDTYDKTNDLRFQYFYNEHGNRRMSVLYDYYRYNQMYDGRYNMSGITTASLLLDKAECMARTGDWQSALSTLTPLREARFTTGTATALTASSQNEALKLILQERRREMPFAVRLMDIKRFSQTDTQDDDVTIARDFYKVTETGVDTATPISVNLKGDSPKLAIPVPALDIQNSQGAIQQNPYE